VMGGIEAVYMLWLEEEMARGEAPMPPNAPNFWDGMNAEAYGKCTWIGASRGQIDEKKETEAALMRIDGGLSTWEKECAQLGLDFREVFAQRSREQKMMKAMGLTFGAAAIAAQQAEAAAQQADQKADEGDNEVSE